VRLREDEAATGQGCERTGLREGEAARGRGCERARLREDEAARGRGLERTGLQGAGWSVSGLSFLCTTPGIYDLTLTLPLSMHHPRHLRSIISAQSKTVVRHGRRSLSVRFIRLR
jgi:hypothetical protein